MILRTILEALGWHVSPTPSVHNQAVHDVLNIQAAALAGHARMVRLQKAVERAVAAGDTDAVAAITTKQDDIRAGLDELARRIG